MTLIEFIVCLICVMIGCVAALWAGRSFGCIGYLAGFLGGFLVIPVGTAALGLLCEMVWGRPYCPACASGTCTEYDYRIERVDDGVVYVCLCGLRYRRAGRRFMQVAPDGSLQPYKIWRASRGWYPEEGSPAA